MKTYQCNKCDDPCFLTINSSMKDPFYCPFKQDEEVYWEKINDDADSFVGYGEIPQKAR